MNNLKSFSHFLVLKNFSCACVCVSVWHSFYESVFMTLTFLSNINIENEKEFYEMAIRDYIM